MRTPLAAVAAVLALPAAAAGPTPPAGRYAPEVRLPGDENLFPVSPDGFIAHSDLVWYGCGRSARERQGGVDPARLGVAARDPYRSPPYWSQKSGAGHRGCPPADAASQTVTFAAGAWTRPYGVHHHARPEPLVAFPANGFALDLHDEFRRGNHDLGRVPVTYQRGRTSSGSYITYWLFYAYNSKNDDLHEGDWERISVRFGRHRKPRQVAYYAHAGSPRICSWDQVERVDKRHPVVFSAIGSHASYPRAGEFSIGSGGGVDQADGGGPRWDTWRSGVRTARQPWYGFGGAWGDRGHDGTTTGPPGPGQRSAADWGASGTKPCDRK